MAENNKAIKKGVKSNSTLFIALAVILVAVFLVTSVGSSSANDVFDEATGLPDNQLTKDTQLDIFAGKDEKLVDEVQEDEAFYNVTYDDSTNEFTLSCDTCVTEDEVILSKNELAPIIEIDTSKFNLEKVWINKNYDVGGFTKDFEAYLINRKDSTRYNLVYRIDDEKFIITDLNKFDSQPLDSDISAMRVGLDLDLYIKGEQSDLLSENIVSFIGIDDNNKLLITKSEQQAYNSGVGRVVKRAFFYFSNEAFATESYLYYNEGGTTGFNQYIRQYAIDELDTYSFDSIAITTDTRTIGFDVASIVKQELSDGDSSFPDKYVKILDSENFNLILDEARSDLTPFIQDRISDTLSIDVDNLISINSNAVVPEISEDITGIVIDNGYISSGDLNNGSVYMVTQIEFNEAGSEGIKFSDLGGSTITASSMNVVNFGNLYDGFDLDTHGTAFLLDLNEWTQAIGVVVNLFTFNFDGVSQFWTEEITNPNLADYRNDGDDYFAFNSFGRNSNNDNLVLTTEQPLDALLEYNGNNYWLFYAFETIDNQEGCMVIDYLNTNLNERIPATICGDILAGSNSVSQFKIASGEETQ